MNETCQTVVATKRPRKILQDQDVRDVMELYIVAAMDGIETDPAERPVLLRWVFNTVRPEDPQMKASFDATCAAVPFDPDIFRDSLENMFPKEVYEATEGRYGWT